MNNQSNKGPQPSQEAQKNADGADDIEIEEVDVEDEAEGQSQGGRRSETEISPDSRFGSQKSSDR